MIEILLIGALGAGFALLFRRRKTKDGLPAPGGPPPNRGEAVRRILKHIERKRIAEITEGTAAVIVGIAHGMPRFQPLVSPISGTPCLGYHLTIHAVPPDSLMLPYRVCDEARCNALEVRDETGSMLVDPAGLELAITSTHPHLLYPPFPPHLLARIRGPYHLPISIVEGLLQPGAQILVCGVAARELAASDYRDGEARLLLRASATFPLVASTDPDLLTPGDRLITPEEVRRR